MTRAGLRAIGWRALATAALLSLAPGLCAQTAPPAIRKIEIAAQPFDSFEPREPSRRVFGSLEFRGGIELRSQSRDFGGLSAIRVLSDGAAFIAVTDKAQWLRGRILYRGSAPVGIADAEMAPMLGGNGRPITERGWYDSEALAAGDDGTLYVAFERVHQILRFNAARDRLAARGQAIALPLALASLPRNRGIDCLAVGPKATPLAGALIAVSEAGLDAEKNIRGFLIGGRAPGEFSVVRKDDFDITDCALTPANELLLLERFFSWRRGVSMRIRRVPLAGLAPGAVVDGPYQIVADMGFQIDNMEGLSVHRAADGALVLTLVSDDNFSILQRTLLLQFTLLEK
ncbi:MAG: esterase-like activity of phytase family protein [Pseudorhodoplanes sp.]